MVLPYLPYPLHSGGQTRSYNLIKHLSKKHQITLFSFIRQPKENQYVKNLSRYCVKIKTFPRGKAWTIKKILLSALTPYSFLMANYYSLSLKKAIKEEIKEGKYDLVHVECFYLMPNISRRVKVPKVLVDQTIEYEVYRHFVQTLPWYLFPFKPFLYFDVLKIFLWEKHFWRKADFVSAVSELDQKIIKKFCRRKKVGLTRNGVDFEKFKKRVYRRVRRPTILFGVANFKWIQNKEAADILLKRIWPKIKKKQKNCQLWVIGRHAPDLYQKYQDQEGVTIKEAKDVLPFYQKAWLLLAPIGSGGGSRTKFFEAMAAGLPIVTTPAGIEGIKAKNGQEVLIGKTHRQLIRLTLKLIKDRRLSRRLAIKEKKLVSQEYSWQRSAEELEKIYQEARKTMVNGQ